jgi:hypothetical protein
VARELHFPPGVGPTKVIRASGGRYLKVRLSNKVLRDYKRPDAWVDLDSDQWMQTAKAPVESTSTNATAASDATQSAEGCPSVKVWVNTASGVYHCPGTRWHGATNEGIFMTQPEAQKKGYRPMHGTVCQ